MCELKQVILVRQDLKLPKGKLAAQVSHASLESALKSPKSLMEKWRREGAKKVVLKVLDLNELIHYKRLIEQSSITNSLIIDAGHTVVEPNTPTCLGIGPEEEKKIDAITGHLKML